MHTFDKFMHQFVCSIICWTNVIQLHKLMYDGCNLLYIFADLAVIEGKRGGCRDVNGWIFSDCIRILSSLKGFLSIRIRFRIFNICN